MRNNYFTKIFAFLLLSALFTVVKSATFVPPTSRRSERILAGSIITQQNEQLPEVTVIVLSVVGETRTISDVEGRFRLPVPPGPLTVRFEAKNMTPVERAVGADEPTENLAIHVTLIVPRIQESVVIQDTTLNPAVDQRNDTIYKSTLFGRDDQLVQTLNAGINAGQHEGGGKSLEIRRFGFNLDHGGVNGGLKVLVDNVQQNQGTQGHGQGYLGQLKSLSPELISDVEILNGPFSSQYGDFSGLGVVQIRLKESLPDLFTFRVHGGSFNSKRVFAAFSPEWKGVDSFLAYEGAYTDGPFINRGRYRRDNLTGSFTWKLGEGEALGFKINLGRNNFYSSGQIPLDEVAVGRLDRFGFVDPFNGGRVKTGQFSAYYRKERASGDVFKVDAFLGRSLFDLFSNFTFFLNDPVYGDEIDQHDSRVQEGANAQYLHPSHLFGGESLLTIGGNFLANQINVGLLPSVERNPNRLALNQAAGIGNPAVLLTRADAKVTNLGGFIQQALFFMQGRLRIEGGLRLDHFNYRVRDGVNQTPTDTELFSGREGATRIQPKAAISYTISERMPLTFAVNYGRGINSQDARGVVQQPDSPRVATTDFYQASVAYNRQRLSLGVDYFVIDHSNEQVYIPDDGSFEFKGPSRSTGYEVKASAQLNKYLIFSGGLTQVTNAFFRGTEPRIFIDSAPRTVADGRVTFSGFHGFLGTLAYRHTSNYRLDGEDSTIRAAGLDVIDLSVTQRIRRSVDLNVSIDNLTDKRYLETQNYFESRLRPGDPVIARIHGTPGFSRGVTVGLTFHLGAKDH